VAKDVGLGPRFRAWRYRKGVAQKVVANALGHSSNTFVSRLERGQVPLTDTVAKRWAAALGVTLDDIRATAPLAPDEEHVPRKPSVSIVTPGPHTPAAVMEFLNLLGPSLARVAPEQRQEAALKARAAIESCWPERTPVARKKGH